MNKNGELDYKEFTAILYGNSSAFSKQHSPEQGSKKLISVDQSKFQEASELLSDRLYDMGINGILGLAAAFRKADKFKSRKVDYPKFTGILESYGLGISQKHIDSLFVHYDKNGDDYVNYEEFMNSLRGRLNAFRKSIIEQAFNRADADADGYVNVQELKGVFDAASHPDVITGQRKENQVFLEFEDSLENFATYRDLINKHFTLADFEDYYAFVSSTIDQDQYFGNLLKNCWRMNRGPNID